MPKLSPTWERLLAAIVLLAAAAVSFAFGEKGTAIGLLVAIVTALGVKSLRESSK